jgi:hypothetical protein
MCYRLKANKIHLKIGVYLCFSKKEQKRSTNRYYLRLLESLTKKL